MLSRSTSAPIQVIGGAFTQKALELLRVAMLNHAEDILAELVFVVRGWSRTFLTSCKCEIKSQYYSNMYMMTYAVDCEVCHHRR